MPVKKVWRVCAQYFSALRGKNYHAPNKILSLLQRASTRADTNNPYFAECSATSQNSRAMSCVGKNFRAVTMTTSASFVAVDDCARAHTLFFKWSRCFFRCAVVITVQGVSIRDRTDATPAMVHG